MDPIEYFKTDEQQWLFRPRKSSVPDAGRWCKVWPDSITEILYNSKQQLRSLMQLHYLPVACWEES